MKNIAARYCLLIASLIVINGASAQDSLLLKNYHPVSIYQIPNTAVMKAAFPVTDLHSHDYATSQQEIDEWVRTMDSVGIARTVILTYSTGAGFDSVVEKYKKYPTRFVFYCGIDYTGFSKPGWSEHAVAELERCYRKGARGIGELGDKGDGELYSRPTPGKGVHIDDPSMKPILQKCAALKMPVSIHVAEDQWMYEKPDSTNDGLMNAAQWHVDMSR
ncbi:MAG: amidohydrolase family protein, partial [Chitinophagaceae bacterium]|nr:amidohydrolase family protein [Chitinophagaceae bacterium]